MVLEVIFWGIPQAMRACALVYPKFKERLKEQDCIAQFALKHPGNKGRWIQLKNGRISTGAGIHKNPTFTIFFKNAEIAKSFLIPPFDQLERIHAAKNFQITMSGPDDKIVWFMHLVASMESYTWTIGTDMGNGVTRYTNGTNGGPIFVYVKDGKILRTTPMDLDDSDPDGYTIRARGKTFKPPRRTTLAAHGACQKSMVYSKNRILKPMKRVDFDHKGERNIQNRGKSEFVEISWDEALEIVSSEIKRCKKVGPGAIAVANGSHHQWGNLGHYLSAFNRFWNLIGVTKLMHTPDSWEGWFWGAQHHWGNSMLNRFARQRLCIRLDILCRKACIDHHAALIANDQVRSAAIALYCPGVPANRPRTKNGVSHHNTPSASCSS